MINKFAFPRNKDSHIDELCENKTGYNSPSTETLTNLSHEKYTPKYEKEINTVSRTAITLNSHIENMVKKEEKEKFRNFGYVFLHSSIGNDYLKYAPALDAFFEKHNMLDFLNDFVRPYKKELEIAIIIAICSHYRHIEKHLYLDMKKIYDIENVESFKNGRKYFNYEDPYGVRPEDEVYLDYIELTKRDEKASKMNSYITDTLINKTVWKANEHLYLFLEAMYALSNYNVSALVEMLVLVYEKTKRNKYKVDIAKLVSFVDLKDTCFDVIGDNESGGRSTKIIENTGSNRAKIDNEKNINDESFSNVRTLLCETGNMPTKFVVDIVIQSFLDEVKTLPDCLYKCRNGYCFSCDDFTGIYYCGDCEESIDMDMYELFIELLSIV